MQLSFRIIMPLIRTVAFFKRSLNVTSIVRYSSICKQKSFNPTEAKISVDKINYVHNSEFKRTISVLNNRLHSADKSANSEFQFDKECDETLESLCEHFEEILCIVKLLSNKAFIGRLGYAVHTMHWTWEV